MEATMYTFATPSPVLAIIDIAAGRVQFIAADRTETTVEIQPADASKDRDVTVAEQTTVEYGDGVLRIRTSARNPLLGPSGSIQVTVHLPTDSRVEGKAASAELRTTGRLGDVAFDGAYSQIKLDEAASVRLTAVDGDVEIERLNGPAEISTARGDIRIAEALRGTVVLSAQSGDLSISAAHGVSASLDAGTGHGRVSNSLTNNGAVDLHIRATTSYGDIVARGL
jgi:hypothetical protein